MKHILVVEDEKYIRDILGHAIRVFGYKVIIACNGKDGLEYFNSHHFNLVTTDIWMPVLNGIELAKYIRSSDSPDTPIIAITTHFGSESAEMHLFNSIIAKPFNLKFLKKVINQLIGP